MNEKITEIKEIIFSSSTDSMGRILSFWPNILGAIGVFLLGWLLAILVEKAILKVASKIKLTYITQKLGVEVILQKAKITSSPSELIAKFLQAWIITVFLLSAAKILHLNAVSSFLETVINFLPNVAVAIFIVLFAIRTGDFIGALVGSALTIADSHAAKILSLVAKNIIITFGIMAALVELHIATELIQILFVGFIAMLALGGGLAFGLGGKDVVRELLENIRHKK